jgi:hypothetical protein
MYRAAQPQGGAGADPNAGTGGPPPPASGGQAKHDAGVVDAEYVDVDEKKTA